jgi:glycosyltransferase involved in cell wall biosynthesis
MRDAIVFSGTSWESCNVTERMAVALSKLGAKVLYCDNPVSLTKEKAQEPHEIEPGIFRFRTRMFGHRLNRVGLLASLQSRMVAKQISHAADKLRFHKPMFFYSYLGRLLPVCAEMKRRGCFLVHICMDFPEPDYQSHVSVADLTLAIVLSSVETLRAVAGARVVHIPQLGPPELPADNSNSAGTEPGALRNIPRPRLIYAGVLQNRVQRPIVREILQSQPEWHFIHIGSADNLILPNAHALPWMRRDELMRVIASCDVGFMPYDRNDPVQRNVFVPLKLLDYFGLGMPVISTPIEGMLELKDLVYTGESASDLTGAIELALNEPADSSKRDRRKEFAQKHSLENFAALLRKILPFEE